MRNCGLLSLPTIPLGHIVAMVLTELLIIMAFWATVFVPSDFVALHATEAFSPPPLNDQIAIATLVLADQQAADKPERLACFSLKTCFRQADGQLYSQRIDDNPELIAALAQKFGPLSRWSGNLLRNPDGTWSESELYSVAFTNRISEREFLVEAYHHRGSTAGRDRYWVIKDQAGAWRIQRSFGAFCFFF